MKSRRCEEPGCGARAADGADVRECDGCTFKFCEEHAATIDGVTMCGECRDVPAEEVKS